MAISGVTDSNSILISALDSRGGTLLRRILLQDAGGNPAPAANSTGNVIQHNEQVRAPSPYELGEASASFESNLIQQNSLFVNETLRNLAFGASVSADTLFFDTRSPVLTALQEIQDLNFVQHNTLLVNETLQQLNYVPLEQTDSLLIDEILPVLEASERTRYLNLIQQNELVINENLADIGLDSLTGGTLQIVDLEAQAVQSAPVVTGVADEPAVSPSAVARQNVNIALADTAVASPTGSITAAQSGLIPPSAASSTGVTTILTAATFQLQVFNPATLPSTVFPDRTPYAVVVYQINDPAPPPSSPQPIDRDVSPVMPVARARPVGEARLRQELRRERGGRQRIMDISYNTPQLAIGQAEKSIRQTIEQVNSDMAARGLPLHLVFAKHEDGFAVDVYDCSYTESCRLSYDVSIELDNLMDVLGNLQDETGIIVDTTS